MIVINNIKHETNLILSNTEITTFIANNLKCDIDFSDSEIQKIYITDYNGSNLILNNTNQLHELRLINDRLKEDTPTKIEINNSSIKTIQEVHNSSNNQSPKFTISKTPHLECLAFNSIINDQLIDIKNTPIKYLRLNKPNINFIITALNLKNIKHIKLNDLPQELSNYEFKSEIIKLDKLEKNIELKLDKNQKYKLIEINQLTGKVDLSRISVENIQINEICSDNLLTTNNTSSIECIKINKLNGLLDLSNTSIKFLYINEISEDGTIIINNTQKLESIHFGHKIRGKVTINNSKVQKIVQESESENSRKDNLGTFDIQNTPDLQSIELQSIKNSKLIFANSSELEKIKLNTAMNCIIDLKNTYNLNSFEISVSHSDINFKNSGVKSITIGQFYEPFSLKNTHSLELLDIRLYFQTNINFSNSSVESIKVGCIGTNGNLEINNLEYLKNVTVQDLQGNLSINNCRNNIKPVIVNDNRNNQHRLNIRKRNNSHLSDNDKDNKKTVKPFCTIM